MFYYLDTKMEWGLEKSIHAFVDDILLRTRSPHDVKIVFEAFDGVARQLGLDMNVDKTELHLVRGAGQVTFRSQHGGCISTHTATGEPHAFYKYLGVYFYTSNHMSQIYEFAKSLIDSFFTHIAPLQLWSQYHALQ